MLAADTKRRWRRPAMFCLLAVATALPAVAREPAITVLADFEDASVAATIGEVRNVAVGDCDVRRVSIPARGTGSLALEIGATRADVSLACNLTFREPARLSDADEIAVFAWITEGRFNFVFQLIDDRDQIFETQPRPIDTPLRWSRIAAPLDAGALRRIRGDGPLAWPIQLHGLRVTTDRIGKQILHLDDVQVTHEVEARDLIRGEFRFDEPTRIYEPGSRVAAAVVLENRSRAQQLNIAVDLAWTRPDGSPLTTQRATVTLPPASDDFRSYRSLDFSQAIRDPGLYKLVATARATGWSAPNTFETTIAVTPSNRRLARGRATFFGARTNLLREPDLDQLLEVRVARDIGVNLLVIDTPWRRIQPARDEYDFTPLDPLIAALTERDMAAQVAIVGAPEWLPSDAGARRDAAAALIRALSAHFDGRLTRFQFAAEALGVAPDELGTALPALRELAATVRAADAAAELIPPPIPVRTTALATAVAEVVKSDPNFPLVFEVAGTRTAAVQQLEVFRQAGGFLWQGAHRWQYDSRPIVGPGFFNDAEDVLSFYVQAAAAGVGGLTWFDLRDDDNDPRDVALWHGLVRRDFSPKTILLGYASAAGQLTGFRCTGAVPGTPDGFDSGLFIGSNRQIAVILPPGNRILPAVLGPQPKARGTLSAQDFERRSLAVLTTAQPPLVPTVARPMFITLALAEADLQPQLTLGAPWLRVPGTVFCCDDTSFTVEIDAQIALRRSYLQVVLPRESTITSSISATKLQAERGETIATEITLTAKSAAEFHGEELILRLSIEGYTLDVPVAVRPLAWAPPAAGGNPHAPVTHALGSAPGDQATAEARVGLSYEPDALHLAIEIEDDRFIPLKTTDRDFAGDRVLVGVARAGGALQEMRIGLSDDRAELRPLSGSAADATPAWTGTVQTLDGGRRLALRIPAPADATLRAGDRLLVAVQYVDDDADGFPAVRLRWGGGLDGSRATDEYRWVELAGGESPARAE